MQIVTLLLLGGGQLLAERCHTDDFCQVSLSLSSMLYALLNSAARLVSGTKKFDRRLTQLLHDDLHWLDVPERVKYKLVSMVRNCLHQKAPQCLMAFLSPIWPVDDIFVPPVVITWLCRDTISARTVVGHSLLLARLPGTH